MKTKLKLNNIFAAVGTLLLLFVFPLFLTNKYFNITLSKFEFFVIVSAVFVVLSFFSESERGKKVENKKGVTFKERLLKTDITDMSFLALIVFGAVTLLVSGNGRQAFLGGDGRYMGYAFFLAAGLAYLFISRHNILQEYQLLAFELSMALACILAVFQACSVDLFNLITPIAEQQRGIFISTFGNIDVFSAFLSISVPISMYMICFKNSKSKLYFVYYITAALGFAGLMLSNSDSGYLGVFVAFWVICLLSFKDIKSLCKFSDLCALFFLTALVYGLLYRFDIVKREMSFLSELITNSNLVYIMTALFLVTSMFLRVIKFSSKSLKVLKTVYIAVSVFLFVSVIGAIIYFTKINPDFDLGSFEVYLRFNDYWGSKRGFVWRIYLELYNGFPFLQKLFGCGQDCLSIALTRDLFNEMVAFGNYTNNAHNEYLQYLVSIGFFGLAAYMTFVISALVKLFKDKENSFLSYPVAVCIIAYLVQAAVNITQPIVTPMLFLFIALSRCAKSTENSFK